MNIYEKLAAVQQETKAPKNLYNSFGEYKYRSAENILEAVKPILERNGALICLSDDIVEIGGRIYVKATATFLDAKDGAAVQVTAFAGETAEKKKLDASQLTGVASSYARKYALNGLLLLDDTKDADTDEFARQTGADKKTKETKPAGSSMAEEIRDLAKQANVPESSICTQAGLEKLDDLTDPQLFARLKSALMAKINFMRVNDGAAGQAD